MHVAGESWKSEILATMLRLEWDDEDEEECDELEYTDRVVVFRDEQIH